MGISKDFLFGEDLEEILSWIESDCFHILPEGASMVTETFFEMQNQKPEAHSSKKCFKTFKRNAASFFTKPKKEDLHAFDREVILPKSKSKDLIQLRKERNQVTDFSGDPLF